MEGQLGGAADARNYFGAVFIVFRSDTFFEAPIVATVHSLSLPRRHTLRTTRRQLYIGNRRRLIVLIN